MNAAVSRAYGPPESVHIESVARPVPGPTDVLIRVRATTVTSADWRLRSLTMPYGFGAIGRLVFGISKPRRTILGSELSGDVVAVGNSVRSFVVGDAVVAFLGIKLGAHAEYCCVPEQGLIVKKPPQLSYKHAAALAFGGTTALDFFRRAKLRAGDRVLINGASGAVGSAMLQLAVHAGATVTAVSSAHNAELLSSLGAVRVIDYRHTDFAAEGVRYDVIVDTVGNAPYARSKHALSERGRLLLVLAPLPEMLRAPWVNLTTRHQVIAGPVAERLDDVRTMVKMAAEGDFTPVIDRCVPLTEIAQAHALVGSGRKRGNVVVLVGAP